MAKPRRTDWVTIDLDGLRKILERRGKAFLAFELYQNAFDEAITRVSMSLTRERPGRYRMIVTDDCPDGFLDLTHAYTMYAESKKKSKAEQRGIFNVGEKFVLAFCEEATITSTTGQVIFDETGRRQTKVKRPVGSEFNGLLKLTDADYREIVAAVRTLIPPPTIETWFNDERIPARQPIVRFEERLPTVLADDSGEVRRTQRTCPVNLYAVGPDETATLYEMGIPVVETSDRYHVDIGQKVPLNVERDGVTPAYLRAVRITVLNHTYHLLTPTDATAPWVREASGDERASDNAVRQVAALAFGAQRVARDPSDPEAEKLAVSQGYTLVSGGALSAGQWSNMKRAGAILPAGQVTPSSHLEIESALAGLANDPTVEIPAARWTGGMHLIHLFAQKLAKEVLGKEIRVRFINDPRQRYQAAYGYTDSGPELLFNVAVLGYKFFDRPRDDEDLLALLIHEWAHEIETDHLSDRYYQALSDLGARTTRIALQWPSLFGKELDSEK